MKRLFITLVAMLLAAAALHAQESLFDKYADREGVTTVFISKRMFDMMKGIEGADIDLGKLSGKINNMQILTCEDADIAKEVREDIKGINRKSGYEELMRVRDEGDRITIYAKEDKDGNDYVLVVDEADALTLIQINGQLTLEELRALADG